MKKSLFEQMDGTYTKVGDYLLLNLTLSENGQRPINVCGRRYARYFKRHHKVLYTLIKCR